MSRSINIVLTFCFLILELLSPLGQFLVKPVNAAALTKYYVLLDRMTVNTTTGGTVCVIPATTATEGKIKVTFPGAGTQSATDYGLNTTPGNWTTSTTNLPTKIEGTTVNAWVTIQSSATTVSGSSVTWTSGDLVVGTLYCFHFTGTSTLSTPTAAVTNVCGTANTACGTVITQTSAPADIDTGTWGSPVITGSGTATDQVTISASVASNFTWTITNTTCALGTLVTTGTPTVCASSPILNISTNSKNGFHTFVKSATGSLSSAASGGSITSPGSYNGTPESLNSASGYVIDAQATAGTPTIEPEYAGTSTTGGHLDTFFQSLAYKTAPVSGAQVTLNVRAEAAATTQYGTDYVDTLTVVAAGSF